MVAGAQQARCLANAGRTEAGTRTEGAAAVEGYANDRNVVVGHCIDLWQACECSQSGIAGNLCGIHGADWLVSRHNVNPSWWRGLPAYRTGRKALGWPECLWQERNPK